LDPLLQLNWRRTVFARREKEMEESTKKSTVSWQEALLYLAIAALLGGGIFVGFGYAF
jgi:hypothetical protein